jgi:23S rRNA (guanosine2251-2'-O)-methyltransferase
VNGDIELIYGRNPVREALRAGRRGISRIWVLPQLADADWLAGQRVVPTHKAELGHMAGTSDHQGVVAEAAPYPYAGVRDLLEADGPIVCLDGAQDPRNFGAICRVADAAGAVGIVTAERGSPGVTPTVCKTSAGAVEHLLVARVGSIAGFLSEATDAGRLVVGSDADAQADFRTLTWRGDEVIVMGSEGTGLRPRVAAGCGAMVRIPMRGNVASLNLSVACALLLFEAIRGGNPE